MKVWVLSTCVPGESEPCWPRVFATEKEADDAFAEAMRGEWDAAGILDKSDKPLPFPDNPNDAHDQLKAYWLENGRELWGQWEITTHNIDLPCSVEAQSTAIKAIEAWRRNRMTTYTPTNILDDFGNEIVTALHRSAPTFVPENEHGVKPGYYTRPDIVRLLRKHHTNPKAVHFIADMME